MSGLTEDHTITALERAFQLAKSGGYASVADIKKRLGAEAIQARKSLGERCQRNCLR